VLRFRQRMSRKTIGCLLGRGGFARDSDGSIPAVIPSTAVSMSRPRPGEATERRDFVMVSSSYKTDGHVSCSTAPTRRGPVMLCCPSLILPARYPHV
jgi:hypothetical protein